MTITLQKASLDICRVIASYRRKAKTPAVVTSNKMRSAFIGSVYSTFGKSGHRASYWIILLSGINSIPENCGEKPHDQSLSSLDCEFLWSPRDRGSRIKTRAGNQFGGLSAGIKVTAWGYPHL